jgi:subfamily B ATP-binding cassette protein HlyB/CyaB
MMETAPPPSEGTPLDPGFPALCGIAAYHRIGADPVQLARELALGARQANEADLIRAAKLIGPKARLVEKVTAERLATLPTPAIVRMTSGALMVFGGRNPSGLCRLVDPISHAAHETPAEDLARDIGGQALLVARRIGGAGVDPRQSGMRWFLPTIWRYRRPLGHVLAASLFVDFRPHTLFFQVVVDKVLTHRGYGDAVVRRRLVVIGVFDVALQYLRAPRSTLPIGSTSSSASACSPISAPADFLFRDPIDGQTVAQVRELDDPGFLTGQALFSALDLVFAFVFVGVCSPIWSLTLIVLSWVLYVVIGFPSGRRCASWS